MSDAHDIDLRDDDPLFGPPLRQCPRCGDARLCAVTDGVDVNFLCEACGACWHVELGYVHRVDPTTCPGCPARENCLSRFEADHFSVTRPD